MSLRILTASEQVAAHLRDELLRGTWKDVMPGGDRLTTEMAVGRGTMEGALLQLEREGLLVPQGAGRPRRIVLPAGVTAMRKLRVALLFWDAPDRGLNFFVDIQHRLTKAGHRLIEVQRTLREMKMDVARIARLVRQTKAEAWVVSAGSLEVLEWFSRQKFPTFAIFGRYRGLPIAAAGPDLQTPMANATHQLITLGHTRIVLLMRRQHRFPKPTGAVKTFLATLLARGIPYSSFWLPDWEESEEGFHECLKSLFRHTPPTAIIVDEALLFTATFHFLASRGIRIPEDVSLVSTEADPDHAWCMPSVAHFQWNYSTLARKVLHWAKNVSQNKKDIRQHFIAAEYVPGGSVGAVTMKEGGDGRNE